MRHRRDTAILSPEKNLVPSHELFAALSGEHNSIAFYCKMGCSCNAHAKVISNLDYSSIRKPDTSTWGVFYSGFLLSYSVLLQLCCQFARTSPSMGALHFCSCPFDQTHNLHSEGGIDFRTNSQCSVPAVDQNLQHSICFPASVIGCHFFSAAWAHTRKPITAFAMKQICTLLCLTKTPLLLPITFSQQTSQWAFLLHESNQQSSVRSTVACSNCTVT